jgi:hypothetical protein
MRNNLFVTMLLCAVVGGGPYAFGDGMVAIVLEVQGTTHPQLGIYPELKHKEEIELGAGATLMFSHYYTCEEVSLEGAGVLTVRKGSYSFSGKIPVVKSSEVCVAVIDYVDSDMEPAGAHKRAITSQKLINTEKPILFISRYDPVHVYEIEFHHLGEGVPSAHQTSENDTGTSITLKLSEKITQWPTNGPSLKKGSVYKVELRKNGKGSLDATLIEIGKPLQGVLSTNLLVLNYGARDGK